MASIQIGIGNGVAIGRGPAALIGKSGKGAPDHRKQHHYDGSQKGHSSHLRRFRHGLRGVVDPRKHDARKRTVEKYVARTQAGEQDGTAQQNESGARTREYRANRCV